jgi:PASTA domain
MRHFTAVVALASAMLASLVTTASAAPSVSVQAPATAEVDKPITVTYSGISAPPRAEDDGMELLSYYERGLTACPATSTEMQNRVESRIGIWQFPPRGPFSYTAQFQVFDAGTYLLCVYLEEFLAADTARPLASANAIIAVSDPSAPPSPTLTPSPTLEPVRCIVPKLVGKTLTRAKKALSWANCRLGRVTRKKKRGVKKGRVIAQSWSARTPLREGSKVKVTVSK